MNPLVAVLAITAAAFGALSHLAAAISEELDAMVASYKVEVAPEVLERMRHE